MSTLHLNHVCIGGNLTREPMLNRLPAGQFYVEFGIAINNSYTTRDGQKIDRICYVEIIAWGRLAEMVAAHVHKGGGVVVDGALVFESWLTQAGESRSRLRVSATSIYFLGGRTSPSEPEENGNQAFPSFIEPGTRSRDSILAGDK